MTNRLDQIITRTGDNGTSSLADGTRLSKAHPRFDAMGDVDELNSNIGVLRSVLDAPIDAALNEFLAQIQHHLFEIGSELAVPGMTFLRAGALDEVEHWAEQANAQLPALQEFILPSGTASASQAHICRSVARRAERALVLLNQTEAQNDASLKYLNRCSDVFFIMARLLNQNAQVTETYWRGVDK
ncbi:MAG: cob(I)yrinic acid a,c-diamide adenosyltransferase [Hydromonas sp.]|nr:cob(I)yrinic acid a,c-diamide adenosyltransferase [Hydromonas sp.]